MEVGCDQLTQVWMQPFLYTISVAHSIRFESSFTLRNGVCDTGFVLNYIIIIIGIGFRFQVLLYFMCGIKYNNS